MVSKAMKNFLNETIRQANGETLQYPQFDNPLACLDMPVVIKSKEVVKALDVSCS
jgi:hypothetical protein